LTKLSEKARYTLAAASQSEPGDNGGLLWNMTGVLGPSGMPVKVKKEEPDDELSIFAGHTRFVSGQMQRGGQSSTSAVAFPAQQLLQHQHQQRARQHQQQQSQGDDGMQYGSYDVAPPRQYPAQYPAQQQPRQRMHSMPSSSNFHALVPPPQAAHEIVRPAPTLNVNVSLNWDPRDYPQSAQDYVHPSPASAMEERMHQHQQQQRQEQQQHQSFYTPDGHSLPPPPSAPYAWPVEAYGLEDQHHVQQQQQQLQHHHHQQQRHHHQQHAPYPSHPHHQQQQQQYTQGPPEMYPHPQHAAAVAYQAHNAELAQLGLAARDSRLDERWSTFMEDSGLLEGIDFRAR
jgi:hypothetical protein